MDGMGHRHRHHAAHAPSTHAAHAAAHHPHAHAARLAAAAVVHASAGRFASTTVVHATHAFTGRFAGSTLIHHASHHATPHHTHAHATSAMVHASHASGGIASLPVFHASGRRWFGFTTMLHSLGRFLSFRSFVAHIMVMKNIDQLHGIDFDFFKFLHVVHFEGTAVQQHGHHSLGNANWDGLVWVCGVFGFKAADA